MQRFCGLADGVHRGPRRVVVTGIGMVSPLGNTLEDAWKQLVGDDMDCEGTGSQCGAMSLEETLLRFQNLSPDRFEREWKIARSLPCQVVAPVRGLEEAFLEGAGKKEESSGDSLSWNPRTTARFVQMALLAGSQAMRQANLLNWLNNVDKNREQGMREPTYNYNHRRNRFGVCVGSGMSAVREIGNAWDIVGGGRIRKLSPHFIPKVLTNSAAGRLSLEYGLRGPNLAPSTACAASAHAIGDALRAIQSGAADLMLAGGAEASIEPLGLAGFSRLRALSTSFNDTPEEASRPFDPDRDGFVMGEGAAILVLEELEHAKERMRLDAGQKGIATTRILAEVTGYAATGDAFHVTAPDEAGRGAERSMMLALQEDSYVSNSEVPIGYINAHATSTPKGDEIEAAVVDRVLGHSEKAMDPPLECYMSSTKGATGHLLGAAGALEAAFTVMSLVDQRIPPTLNLSVDSEVNRNGTNRSLFTHVTGTKGIRPTADIEMAMSNSFGFGGTNASLVFRRYEDDRDSEKKK